MRTFFILCVTAGAALGGQPFDVVDLPLGITRSENCWFDGQSARLLGEVWAPDAEGRIALEAERPNRYYCNPDKRLPGQPLPTDEAASDGAYLDEVSYARYDFEVDADATYALWARVATGVGKHMFRHYADGRGTTGIFQENNEKDPQRSSASDTWHWVKRGQVRLTAGAHWLETMKYASAFPRIDKWVLSPDSHWQPQGIGPVGASRKAKSGIVETDEMQVPGLVGLSLPADWPAPGVRVESSTDGGASWQPYDSQGRYTTCPVHLLGLQRQFTPWLYEATFRDTVGVKTDSPKMQARLLRVESPGVRGALMTIVSRDGVKDVTVSVDRSEVGSIGAAFFVDSEGNAGTLALGRLGNPLLFQAPTALASFVFLSSPNSATRPTTATALASCATWRTST